VSRINDNFFFETADKHSSFIVKSIINNMRVIETPNTLAYLSGASHNLKVPEKLWKNTLAYLPLSQ